MAGRVGGHFARGLDPAFIDALNAPSSWWRSFAENPELFIAVRDGSVNVYSHGASLLKLTLREGRLVGQVHPKYLLRPDADGYVDVLDGRPTVNPAELIATDLTDSATLARAALPWAGDEKSGVHALLRANETIIDVEAALVTDQRVARRIDFVNLEERGTDVALVFYEAKHFDNPELRAHDCPPVLDQLADYQALLVAHEPDVLAAYRRTCAALLALEGAGLRRPRRDELMKRVRDGKANLVLDPRPRLSVFGFDADQRDGAAWGVHRARLEAALGDRLVLRGTPGRLT